MQSQTLIQIKKINKSLHTIEIGITPFLSNFLVSYLKGIEIISDILLMLEEEENMMVCNYVLMKHSQNASQVIKKHNNFLNS